MALSEGEAAVGECKGGLSKHGRNNSASGQGLSCVCVCVFVYVVFSSSEFSNAQNLWSPSDLFWG